MGAWPSSRGRDIRDKNMPYIDPIRRSLINSQIQSVIFAISENPSFADRRGDVISFSIYQFLVRLYSEASYQTYNEAMGVLSAARREFVRRRVSSIKIQQELIDARGSFGWALLESYESLRVAIEALVVEITTNKILFDKRAGVANYTITRLLIAFYLFPQMDELQQAAQVIGQVADAFYEHQVIPYEDKKILECGDVFPEGSDL